MTSDTPSSAEPVTRRQLRALKNKSATPTETPQDGTAPISVVYAPTPPAEPAAPRPTATIGRQSTGTTNNYVITDSMQQLVVKPEPLVDVPARKSGTKKNNRSGMAIVLAITVVMGLLVSTFALLSGEETQPVAIPNFTSGPADGQEVLTNTVEFSMHAAGATELSCQLDAGEWAPCASPLTLTNLSEGVHTLRVRGTANSQTSPATSTSWIVTTPNSTIDFTSGPTSGSVVWQLPIVFGFTAANPQATPECKINDQNWAPCADKLVVDNITHGRHVIGVRDASTPDASASFRTFQYAKPAEKPTKPGKLPLNAAGADAVADGAVDGNTTPLPTRPAVDKKPDLESPQPTPNPQATNPLRPISPGAGTPTTEPEDNFDRPRPQPEPTRNTPRPIEKPINKPVVGTPRSGYGAPANMTYKRHNGDFYITKPGVYEGLDIRGFVKVKSSGVTLKNSIVRGGKNPPRSIALIQAEYPNVTIENVTLSPSHPSVYIDGIKGYGFTAKNVDINNVVDSVLIFGSNSAVLNSKLHSNRHFKNDPHHGGRPSHDDGIQVEGGRNNRIIGNHISGATSAAIMITQNRARTENLIIRDNYLTGGGCTINIDEKGKGPLPGLTIGNNTFGTSRHPNCPIIAPRSTNIKTWGNTYKATGLPAKVRAGQ